MGPGVGLGDLCVPLPTKCNLWFHKKSAEDDAAQTSVPKPHAWETSLVPSVTRLNFPVAQEVC